MPDQENPKKQGDDDGKKTPPKPDTPKPDQVPTFTSGHRAVVEVNFSYRTEADPNSESVKTFLKAVGDFSQGRSAKSDEEE